MTKARTLADNFAADISGITAGTGITGGGTSGTVTVTNSMATAIDAKGDLVVGTGADTFSRLAVASTAGYLLTVDSAESTGLKWAAPAGGGKVLQVVTATYSTAKLVYSTSWTDSDLTASITPSSASSKVLILVSQPLDLGCDSNKTSLGGGLRIMRDATAIFGNVSASAPANPYFLFTNSEAVAFYYFSVLSYLDSPNTTSATTYKTQIAANSTSTGERIRSCGGSNVASIILMEIGA